MVGALALIRDFRALVGWVVLQNLSVRVLVITDRDGYIADM